MNNSIEQFNAKLNQFRRAYYLRKLLEGIFKVFVYSLSIIFIASVFEVGFNFSSQLRLILLFLLSISFLGLFFYFVLLPLFCLAHIFKGKTDREFCLFIQSVLAIVKDIPINILELSQLPQTQLVCESIIQKFSLISEVDFNVVVRQKVLHDNRISIYFSIVVLLLLSTLHNTVQEGFNRIWNYSVQYSDKNSLIVEIDEESLFIEQGKDLKINIIIKNNDSNREIFISANGNNYVLSRQQDTIYNYVFKSVRNTFKFNVTSEGFVSKSYTVFVYEPPLLTSYSTDIQFPKYVNKTDTTVENQNILIVPQGTFLNFGFYGSNYDTLSIISLPDSTLIQAFAHQNVNKYRLRVLKNCKFKLRLSNNYIERDFINFNIVSVNDAYPEIQAQLDDSVSYEGRLNFIGKISDDYGFTKLLLFKQENNKIDTIVVPIYKNLLSQKFFYTYYLDNNFDFEERNLSFWFEIYDNDAVNGIKKTQSTIFNHTSKNIIQQTADKEKKYNELFYRFMNAQSQANEIKTDIEKLRRKMLDENLTDWERNNILKQISDKTQKLEEQLNQISQDYKQATNSLMPEQNKELLEKQELISEMIKDLIDDEMKRMYQEIQQMSNNQNKDLTPEQIKKELESFEKSIDKLYELAKKIKLEESILNLSDNLNMLSQKHAELVDKDKEKLNDDVNNQEKILNDLKNEYQNIKEENNTLTRPFDMNDFESEFEDIENEFNNEKNALEQNNIDGFNESVKQNAEKMEKLSQELKKMIDDNNASTESENADDLRVMLDNLFEVSFELENVYASMSDVNKVNQDAVIRLTKILDNFKLVRDSLYALSLRTPYLNNQISKSAFLIEDELISSLKNMQEQNSYKAKKNQREALKQTNEMILLLSESLKDINGVGAGPSKKKKQKKQPETKQSLSDMRKMQESLKNQMKDLLNQMKNDNGKQLNNELAKSLVQNEIYQQMLQQMMYNSDIDDKTAKILQEIEKLMQANHRDLANNRLSAQTMLRQQKILTKLLEAENAENEREEDNKRESTASKNINRKSPDNLPEDFTFDKNVDLLNKNNLRLNSFYKKKYEEYINQLNTTANE
ncbi:MAG: hypothetical protein IKZ99_05335 [Salinivirgaceae bacterium]|nr:hypothetical protein [Salinivirgaceae bacterium]